jgi:phosphate transport system substrate-binding protein
MTSLDRRQLVAAAFASALAGAAPRLRAQSSASASASAVLGAGATFPAKVYARWGAQFAQAHGVNIAYKPTGSGDGIQQASERKVDFGGTDSPLAADELAKKRLVQIPMLVGGVVPVVNLPGLDHRRLRLTGDLLGDIMAGRIERWDDGRIAALSPGVNLPAKRIVRVVRADKSGTSEGFTRYLAQVCAGFKAGVGAGSSLPKWSGEVEAGEGNDGVASAVKRTAGAIGYVSFDRVESSGLTPAWLQNRAGQWVAPSEAGFRAAILHSRLHTQGDDTAPLLDLPGADSWPITLTSFVLVDAAPAEAARVEPALRFLYWCFQRGDALTRGSGFAPLPTAMQARLAARFAEVRPARGGRPTYQSI